MHQKAFALRVLFAARNPKLSRHRMRVTHARGVFHRQQQRIVLRVPRDAGETALADRFRVHTVVTQQPVTAQQCRVIPLTTLRQ